GLAEVVGAHPERLGRLLPSEAPAGADVVHRRVVALVEAAAELLLDGLLAVHPVAPEALAEPDHGLGVAVGEQCREVHVAGRNAGSLPRPASPGEARLARRGTRSPRVHAGPLLGVTSGWRRKRAQDGGDPPARLRRVDDVVDLEDRGDVERLPVLVRA